MIKICLSSRKQNRSYRRRHSSISTNSVRACSYFFERALNNEKKNFCKPGTYISPYARREILKSKSDMRFTFVTLNEKKTEVMPKNSKTRTWIYKSDTSTKI